VSSKQENNQENPIKAGDTRGRHTADNYKK